MRYLHRLGALILALFSAHAFPARAQTCGSCVFLDCHTPAISVPGQSQGNSELEPSDPGILPASRDSSHLNNYGNPEFIPRWISVDTIEDASGKWLFAATNMRLQAWSLGNPDLPNLIADLAYSQTGLQAIIDAHTATVFSTVRTAPNNANQVAIGGGSGVGVGVFNTTNKTSPALRYQDREKDVNEVYTARLGANRDYLFAAGHLGGAGVRVYDMTTIAGLGAACLETTPSTILCGNSYVGTVGPSGMQRAMGVSGVGNFIAIAAQTFEAAGGIYIYNVSTPQTPLQVMSGLQGTGVNDVAMWQQGASYYLAIRVFSQARIYDVSCIAGGSCALGTPLWTTSMPNSTQARISFSRSGSTPMLYWTTGLACGNGTTGEVLYEVTNPAAPRALADPAYWRYYQWDTNTGFNFFAPFEGKFLDDRFYRAAASVLDAHRWGSSGPPPPPSPPTIGSITASPSPASVCQPVSFTANNVTNGGGATYSWEVRTEADALVTSNSGINLNPYVWNTTGAVPGNYRGRLIVTNAGGASAPAQSNLVAVNGLTPLAGTGTFAPTKVVDNSGAVQFNVAAAGATEWSWDFGDSGGVFGAWTTNPVTGPSPTHVYTSSGDKTVRVQVRNCAEGPATSNTLSINVPLVNPLVASFAKTACSSGFGGGGGGSGCFAPTNVSFADSSTGAQIWDYDWDCRQDGGDCAFEETADQGKTAPVTGRLYNVAGTYTPKLRVRRGASEENTFTHSAFDIQGTPIPVCGNLVCENGETPSSCPGDCGSPPPPPPNVATLQISGPTSGLVNAPYVFSASASNCSPAPDGWNWSHTGNAAATTTNSISIQWTTAGTKSVTVTNSGCSNATNSHTVVVTAGGSQSMVAAFTTQVNGLTVSFNATSSQGSPTSFLWNFGDGQTGNGMTVQHTYTSPGSYTVVLSVARQDPSCTFGLCSAEKSSVVSVGGGGTPTPTPPPPTNGLCQGDADTFCALDGDFEIEVDWQRRNGETGVGRLVNGGTSDNTGVFYFFEQGNWELLLKVIDACSYNDHYWVFGGAATDVKYQIRVTDLVTDEEWTYDNALGHRSDAITDTAAFATCSVNRSLMRANAAARAADLDPRVNPFDPPPGGPTPTPSATPTPPPSPTPPPNVGPCDPNASTLCALSERFQVRVNWERRNGTKGTGNLIPTVTDNTGVFWFFEAENWELLVKVINGCAFNDRYWVFGAGATDVNYTVTVEDLVTHATWEYENAQGHASPAITDTSAFDTCP